ncbi:MAG TPA: TIGR04053 family radical SAM/SPASM domain-containing protein [Terracidiphilus sp.]|nr:TIGR04053 family radical SAM/SPASM domain-containing protein [Terracidiphilus sp.]
MQPMHQIPARGGRNYDEAPFLAIWEVTQSCDLACKHCRAAAQPVAHPEQLSTEEGKKLIDQIAAMEVPIFVFTGGDPLKRPDLYELIRYAAEKNVKVAVTPSATPLLTREAIFKMKEAGIVRLGISLDGSTPKIHDTFRGLKGAWARTMQAIAWANEAGIPIQVHTTISRHNAHDLDNLCALFEKQKIVMWNVFFLVPVGRGQLGDLLSGEEFELVFGKIYELSQRVSFQIKTTEAMHYRRYLLQHNLKERQVGHGLGHGHGHPQGAAQAYEPGTPKADATTRNLGWATRRVNDGKGFLFVSHTGHVYPSGFLPLDAGSIREKPLAEIYREAPIFKALRDTSQLKGKCGVCEYKEICGGSRARAYALTGDPLEQEQCCIYQPRNWFPPMEAEEPAGSAVYAPGELVHL